MLGKALLAAALMTTPVAATTVTITFEGTAYGGVDNVDAFGLGVGADLTGQDVTMTYTFDSATGISGESSKEHYQLISGPTGTASIEINGVTLSYANPSYFFFSVQDEFEWGDRSSAASSLATPAGTVGSYVQCKWPVATGPNTVFESYKVDENSDAGCYGSASLRVPGSSFMDPEFTVYAIFGTAEVPLPAGGPLLISALGSLTFIRRRITAAQGKPRVRLS